MQVKYKNKSRNGLLNKHEYVIKLFEPKGHIYAYTVHFIYDITAEEEMDKVMYYSSKNSINRNFDYNKWETED